jgi:hypothetical protein
MAEHPDIEQTPAGFENAVEVLITFDQIRPVMIQDQVTRRILDSTTSGESVDLLEHILELLTGH